VRTTSGAINEPAHAHTKVPALKMTTTAGSSPGSAMPAIGSIRFASGALWREDVGDATSLEQATTAWTEVARAMAQ
jgi:hypothetical protein